MFGWWAPNNEWFKGGREWMKMKKKRNEKLQMSGSLSNGCALALGAPNEENGWGCSEWEWTIMKLAKNRKILPCSLQLIGLVHLYLNH